MKIVIILQIAIIVYLVFKHCFPIKNSTNSEFYDTQKFVVSEYLNRIEKESDDIREQPKEKYFITLWWGSDGLRLNEDRTTEWINKSKVTTKQKNKIGYTTLSHDAFSKMVELLEYKMVTVPQYNSYLFTPICESTAYSIQDCCTQSLVNQYMNQYTNQKIQSTMSCINSTQSCAVRNSVVW